MKGFWYRINDMDELQIMTVQWWSLGLSNDIYTQSYGLLDTMMTL